MKKTEIYKGHARWGRTAIIWFEDNKIVFDCSDEEYGPIEFDINLVKTALQKHEIPYVSDDFQIGPDGAYEATNEVLTIQYQQQLIELYEQQIADLTMMSKIELGDDVIEEIKRLKTLINEQSK